MDNSFWNLINSYKYIKKHPTRMLILGYGEGHERLVQLMKTAYK